MGIEDYYYRLIAIPTWKCGYKCKYCDYEWYADGSVNCFNETHSFGESLTAKEWIDGLKRITQDQMTLLDFSGGEPLVYKEIVDLINGLPEEILWCMTTSLQNERFKEFDYENCDSMTCSYHYQVDKNEFLDKLYYFEGKQVCVSSTLVLAPWNINEFREAARFFNSNGILINTAVYLTRGFTWDKYPEQKKEAESILKEMPWDAATKTFEWKAPYKAGKCFAGDDYFMIQPDGSIDRCYSYFIYNKPHIGNIKDDPITRFYTKECEAKCMVPCDHFRVEKEVL